MPKLANNQPLAEVATPGAYPLGGGIYQIRVTCVPQIQTQLQLRGTSDGKAGNKYKPHKALA